MLYFTAGAISHGSPPAASRVYGQVRRVGCMEHRQQAGSFTNVTIISLASASNMVSPLGVAALGNSLFVAEQLNNRVVEYSPATNFASASGVYGQPNFTTVEGPIDGPSPSSLNGPRGRSVSLFAFVHLNKQQHSRCSRYYWQCVCCGCKQSPR